MGVGAGLWEHLSAVKVEESLSFLRDKKLAIDLSYWLVQQQEVLKAANVRKPHLRLTFFRVIILIARVGARPFFVVDGKPPPMKRATQEKRLKRSSPLSAKHFSPDFENLSQSSFKDNVEECVAMLEYLGVPVIRAEGEAESLCAELDRRGLVDACVTPDSDAFVHGAECVIKFLQTDPKDPLVELYRASDVKEKLGLQQSHLLALALLVGCDYTDGVPGVGFQNALRLVQCFPESEILDRLRAWGQGEVPVKVEIDQPCDSDEENRQMTTKYTHCSKCGHLGNKRLHLKLGCETCAVFSDQDPTTTGCNQKSKGFRCSCHFCTKEASKNQETRSRAWWTKICSKMANTPGFPDENIIDVFLKPDTINPEDLERLTSMNSQQAPDMEMLESFLAENLFWEATYIRSKTLPLLSHLYLVELAAMNSGACTHNRPKGLINDFYRPRSIERLKVSYSERLFVLKWETLHSGIDGELWLGTETQSSESGHLSFTTDENIALVRAACPELANVYDKEQAAKQEKRTKKVKRKGVEEDKDDGQRLIKSYFRESKRFPNIGDEMDRLQAFEKLGEFQRPVSSLLPTSPSPGSPPKMPCNEPVARKLNFGVSPGAIEISSDSDDKCSQSRAVC